ncbi:uncharacterized protein LOC120281164 [Dioscorea cayenensis subsp. rotundata]|uniref:Uncharacterized protein LOC120281164 n=1 Tax=Dioscorea cayennensis subsp. rotundata TaxID=55577 RepID=A0AB40CV63_DIOCR|nr:uncharacterized protein LOC120281164 [Dioscorea cayenensis subsp. rotundata]
MAFGWSIISDMRKGLIHAVRDFLPLIEHRMCARHIYARWGKRHLVKKSNCTRNVARSTNKVEMLMHLDRMRGLKDGTSAADDLLENWPIEGWCVAFFNDVVKCEVIDNNMSETFNGVILEARHKPVITMLEDIRQYCMTRIVIKRDNAAKWNSPCGPRIMSRIEKERVKSSKWRWDKTGIPCQHGLATLAFQGLDPLDYVSDWFKKETYLKAYQFPISPLGGRDFWPLSEAGPMLPPMAKRMPGRSAKKRRREAMEPKNRNQTKLSREGRVMTCSKCHIKGHNKSHCLQRINHEQRQRRLREQNDALGQQPNPESGQQPNALDLPVLSTQASTTILAADQLTM